MNYPAAHPTKRPPTHPGALLDELIENVGKSKSEIARQCGVARGTVRGYIKAAEEEGLAPGQDESALDEERLAALAARLHPSSGRPRGDGWQLCQEHQEYISKKLEADVRLTKVRKLLA